jgi:hypothetical protein
LRLELEPLHLESLVALEETLVLELLLLPTAAVKERAELRIGQEPHKLQEHHLAAAAVLPQTLSGVH